MEPLPQTVTCQSLEMATAISQVLTITLSFIAAKYIFHTRTYEKWENKEVPLEEENEHTYI